MLQDLRFGARMLFKQRRFTAMTIITLALGVGATTAIFSVVDAVLLRSLPFPEADRLVYLREVNASGGEKGVAEPNFADIEARSRSFAALGYAGGGGLVVTGGSEAVRARVSYASQRVFEALGVKPFAGRAFLAEEMKYGGPTAALVSFGFCRRLVGGGGGFRGVGLDGGGGRCGGCG